MHLVFVDRLLYIKLRSVFKNISASTKNIECSGLLIDEKNERFLADTPYQIKGEGKYHHNSRYPIDIQ